MVVIKTKPSLTCQVPLKPSLYGDGPNQKVPSGAKIIVKLDFALLVLQLPQTFWWMFTSLSFRKCCHDSAEVKIRIARPALMMMVFFMPSK